MQNKHINAVQREQRTLALACRTTAHNQTHNRTLRSLSFFFLLCFSFFCFSFLTFLCLPLRSRSASAAGGRACCSASASASSRAFLSSLAG